MNSAAPAAAGPVCVEEAPPSIPELLAEARSLQVATVNPDGSPHLVPVWFGFVDGQLAFWAGRTSRKAVNMRRDPRIACLVEAGERFDELRGVTIRATARLFDDPIMLARIGEAVFERNLPPSLRRDVHPYVTSGRRVGVVVDLLDVVAWDRRGSGQTVPAP